MYKRQSYSCVGPAKPETLPISERNLRIYYTLTGRYLTVTLREDLLKRATDRARSKKTNEKNSVSPWLGKSAALRAEAKAFKLLGRIFDEEYQENLRLAAWRNIPILNALKSMFPQEDPCELYRKIWKTKLVCPAGGRYIWSSKWHTMESTLLGSPANPKRAPNLTRLFRQLKEVSLGITFKYDGIMAKAILKRTADK